MIQKASARSGYRTLVCYKKLKEELSETQAKDPGQEAAKEGSVGLRKMSRNVVNSFLMVSFDQRGFVKPRKVWWIQRREEKDLNNRELFESRSQEGRRWIRTVDTGKAARRSPSGSKGERPDLDYWVSSY